MDSNLFRMTRSNHVTINPNGSYTVSDKAFHPDNLPNSYRISVDQQIKSAALRAQYPLYAGSDQEISFQVFKASHNNTAGVILLKKSLVEQIDSLELEDRPEINNAAHANIYFRGAEERNNPLPNESVNEQQIGGHLPGIGPIHTMVTKRVVQVVSKAQKKRNIQDEAKKLYDQWENSNGIYEHMI